MAEASHDFRGRVALITGGGGGIGGAIARELARRGAAVVVNDAAVSVAGTAPGETTATATVDAIELAGGVAIADHSSVADPVAMAALAYRVEERFGGVDIVVNAAGITSGTPFEDVTTEEWDRMLGTHVGGHLTCIGTFLPQMAARGFGRVITVTSGAGLQRVSAGTAVYGTAKRAIAELTWHLAARAPRGVTVNALSPIAHTRMITGASSATSTTSAGAPAGYALDFSAMPPPDSLAPVVAYLCSEASGWLNGTIVFTNGAEVSVVRGPQLIEAVAAPAGDGHGPDLKTVVERILAPAARTGRTSGGSMPRLPAAAGGTT